MDVHIVNTYTHYTHICIYIDQYTPKTKFTQKNVSDVPIFLTSRYNSEYIICAYA